MLRILHFIFSILAFGLAIFTLITNNFNYQGLMFLFLGLTMLVMSIQEFKRDKKGTAWMLIVASVSSLFVSVQSFII